LALIGFAFIDHNPFVRLEAVLGLSPSPIERLFGVKSLFSGMTEGVHQFVRFNLCASIKANIFSPAIIPMIIFFIFQWDTPKVDTRKKEYIFFSIFIILSIIVNIVN
jgi:uncharacterized Tic20 family protein